MVSCVIPSGSATVDVVAEVNGVAVSTHSRAFAYDSTGQAVIASLSQSTIQGSG